MTFAFQGPVTFAGPGLSAADAIPIPPTLRGSETPLAIACPGSIRPTTIRIDREHEAGKMGVAVHAIWTGLIRGEPIAPEDCAKQHNVDLVELQILTRYAQLAWRRLRAEFPSPMSETFLEAPLCTSAMKLTGHPDLLSVIPAERRAHVGDLKTGRLDSDHFPQVMAYCLLVFENYPDIDDCDACVIWLRDDEIERYRITRAQAMEWKARLIDRVVTWDGVFHPGAHCGGCQRSHNCPALIEMARRDLAVLTGGDLANELATGLRDLPDEQICALRSKAKMLTKILESLDAATRVVVRERGSLKSSDGWTLRFVQKEEREIDTLAAWPVLQKQFTDEEIAGGVKVRIGALQEIAKRKAGYGNGAAAIRALSSALEDAGAVHVNISEALTFTRK